MPTLSITQRLRISLGGLLVCVPLVVCGAFPTRSQGFVYSTDELPPPHCIRAKGIQLVDDTTSQSDIKPSFEIKVNKVYHNHQEYGMANLDFVYNNLSYYQDYHFRIDLYFLNENGRKMSTQHQPEGMHCTFKEIQLSNTANRIVSASDFEITHRHLRKGCYGNAALFPASFKELERIRGIEPQIIMSKIEVGDDLGAKILGLVCAKPWLTWLIVACLVGGALFWGGYFTGLQKKSKNQPNKK